MNIVLGLYKALKTKKGTYIYLSGKFNTLDEAIKHQKILYMSGLKECFVVLINN